MKHTIYEEMEKASKWGVPRAGARLMFWAEYDRDTKALTGNTGCLRAVTEMEAIDRLREAYPAIGAIKWISRQEY